MLQIESPGLQRFDRNHSGDVGVIIALTQVRKYDVLGLGIKSFTEKPGRTLI